MDVSRNKGPVLGRYQRNARVLTATQRRLRFKAHVRHLERILRCSMIHFTLTAQLEDAGAADQMNFPFGWHTLVLRSSPSPPVLLQRFASFGTFPVKLQSSALLFIGLVSWISWLRFGGGVSPSQAHSATHTTTSPSIMV